MFTQSSSADRAYKNRAVGCANADFGSVIFLPRFRMNSGSTIIIPQDTDGNASAIVWEIFPEGVAVGVAFPRCAIFARRRILSRCQFFNPISGYVAYTHVFAECATIAVSVLSQAQYEFPIVQGPSPPLC